MQNYFDRTIEQATQAAADFMAEYRARHEGEEPDPETMKDHYRRLLEAGKKRDILTAIDKIETIAREAAGAVSILQAYTDPEDPDHPDIVGAQRILTDIADKAQAAGETLDRPQMNGKYYFFDCMDGNIGDDLLTAGEVSTRLYGTDRGLTESDLKAIAADYEAELHLYEYMDGSELGHKQLTFLTW